MGGWLRESLTLDGYPLTEGISWPTRGVLGRFVARPSDMIKPVWSFNHARRRIYHGRRDTGTRPLTQRSAIDR